jgi:hypothetical protein
MLENAMLRQGPPLSPRLTRVRNNELELRIPQAEEFRTVPPDRIKAGREHRVSMLPEARIVLT